MTVRHTSPPTLRQDLVLLGVLACLGAALLGGAGLLCLAVTTTTGLVTGLWRMPPWDQWGHVAATVLAHPDQPGLGLPAPWGPAGSEHPVLLWSITLGLTAATVAALAPATVLAWRRLAPMPPGHATRGEIHAELSEHAARRTAAVTRPTLTGRERTRCRIEDVAVPLHRAPRTRQPMWAPLENPTAVLAPTQAGKSRQDLVHKILAAPGALLCSSSKPDLVLMAGLARARRGGPVLVVDATGTVTWPAPVRWSPIEGCTDTTVARRRAETMVESASLDLARLDSGNDAVFRDRAKSVLQAYLVAAAHHRRDVADLVTWAVLRDPEPVELLKPREPDLARNLRAELAMVAETADAVWLSVRRVLEPIMDRQLRALATPTHGAGLDIPGVIAQRGSIFIVAGEHQSAQAAPLLTALVEQWLTTAQDLALEQDHERLDPPATAVLDELCTATPVPRLPSIIADSAGRGVLIHYALQSLAQAEARYGSAGLRQLLDNTTSLTVFGGLKDKTTLEWLSVLTGQHDQIRYHAHSPALLSVGSTSVGTETVPTHRPGDIRTLPRGRVLVLHRHLRPILAHTLDVTARPDWPHLRADLTRVRGGDIPIGPDGHLTDEGPSTAPAPRTPHVRHRPTPALLHRLRRSR
ncbi:type IV secretory system conjugative DNA transfer family protein [Streptoalloteichus hindustanus]|uniref:TraM recognition site of TraD and TraG n=1 Tax=Streptoalloteichus hindustanus TaxID=2017 RepID=A0A1M5MAP7_STRHI|nr:TraM recognition domain-containing protein [Streptoalloteichus hindustanus]SHG73773.1 TraM recognition site of TraD and TraG [Streptoalloteichus hindustanus]